MPGRQPFARLPDDVALSRDEIAIVLFALDLIEESTLDESHRREVRRAIRIITTKLWPELGGLLEDDDE